MNTGGGSLSFDAVIRDVNFKSQLDNMERRILGLSNTAVRETSRIDSVFQNLGKVAAGAFVVNGLSDLPQQILKVRGEYQQLEIAFTTMLRSKTKADALLNDVTKFAADTPFGLKEVAQGAKQLLAYGFAAKDLIPTMSRLGDISAGLGLPLERLTYLYGTTKTQGRLFAQDLNQFVGSGIPLIAELAKQFGVTEDKVRDLVESGKVGFKEVKKAIESMTTGAGIFAGTLDAQSKSLVALRERLSSAWELMLNDIGKKNEALAANVFGVLTTSVEHYQDFVDVLKVATVSYGAYRAAVLLTSIAQEGNIAITAAQAIAQAQAANAGGFLTASQIRAASATALLSRAQAALNTVMSINPFILIATAIAALVTAYFVFREETQKIQSAQEILAKSAEGVTTKFNTQKAEVSSLISILKNQNVAESERLKAYNRLNEIAPTLLRNLDFQKAKTADLTAALNDYLSTLRQQIRLESGQDDLKTAYKQEFEAIDRKTKAQEELNRVEKEAADQAKRRGNRSTGPDGSGYAAGAGDQFKIEEARRKVREAQEAETQATAERIRVEQAYGKIVSSNTIEALEAEKKKQETILATASATSREYKNAEDAIVKLDAQILKLKKDKEADGKAQAQSIDQINAKIKEQQDLLGQQTTRAGAAKVQAEIKRLEEQKRRLTGEMTSAEKKAQKDADKIGPYGSISYWNEVARKAQEIIDKTPSSNPAKLAEQSAIKLDAEQKAEAIRKANAVKSFDEELADKKAKYELYVKWVEAYGQEAADRQFSDLIKTGKSYLEFINTQIANLENERDNAGLTPTQTTQLGDLLNQRDTITGKKTNLDLFNESLEKAQREAGSLAGYLDILNQKQAELDTKTPVTEEDFAIRRALAEATLQTRQQLSEQLVGYLSDVEGSEVKRLAITKKYADLRAGLEEAYANKFKDEGYQRASKTLTKNENEELKQFKNNAVQASDSFKKLDEVVVESGRAAMKKRLALLNDFLRANKTAVDTEAYQVKLKERNELAKALDSESIRQYATLVDALGESLINMGGDAAEAGKALKVLGDGLNTALSILDGSTDPITAGTKAVLNFVNSLVTSAQQRKAAEEGYYKSVISAQQQYNLLLNDQLGLQSKSQENISGRNFEGEIRDGLLKYQDAQQKFREALSKLNQGKAIVGTEEVTDWTNVLKGAMTGLFGAAVGFFAGKKTVPVFDELLKTYPDLIQKSADGVDRLNSNLAETLIAQNLVDDATKELLQTTIDWQNQMDKAKEQITEIITTLAGNLGSDLRDSLVTAFEAGTSSAQAFGNSVSKVLENILSQILFQQVFSKQFDQLQKEMEASFAQGGDGSWIDDFGRFFGKADELTKLFNEGLQSAQDAAKQYGLNIFSNSKDTASNSLNNAIRGVTEETANILAGQINAIRITQAETVVIIRQQLVSLSNIDRNTARIEQTNDLLDKINTTMSGLNDGLRAKGIY